MAHKRVAILGGGFSGLAAAHHLQKAGMEVKIFEKNSHLGGLAAGFQEEHWKWSLEIFYHHWFTSDNHVLQLSREIGVEDKLLFKRPLTVFETSFGEFVPLDSAMALLKFKDLPFLSRLRMGIALAFLKVTTRWEKLEQVTARKWGETYMGVRGFEAIWAPLLVGKFGDFADRVNMAWLWARIKTRTPRLGTFDGGFQKFIDALSSNLASRGVQIATEQSDLQIESKEKKWKVFSPKHSEEFDAVLVAASPGALTKLYPQLDPVYKNTVQKSQSLGAQVLIVTLNRALSSASGAYWFSLKKTHEQPFLALVDHSQFVDARNFGNEFPIYIADYVDVGSEEWKRSDDELVELAFQRLKQIQPKIEKNWINKTWVFREPYAQPVPLVNASKNVPPIKVPGAQNLFHASLAHVYPWDRGTNFALELGKTSAELIVNALHAQGEK